MRYWVFVLFFPLLVYAELDQTFFSEDDPSISKYMQTIHEETFEEAKKALKKVD